MPGQQIFRDETWNKKPIKLTLNEKATYCVKEYVAFSRGMGLKSAVGAVRLSQVTGEWQLLGKLSDCQNNAVCAYVPHKIVN